MIKFSASNANQLNYFNIVKAALVLSMSTLLIACGSGGGASSSSNVFNETSASNQPVSSQVEVISPVVISTQPQNVTIGEGAQVVLSVGAQGGGQLSFQWRKNGADILGETSNALNLFSASLADAGTYDVVVSNSVGSVSSLAALVTVNISQPTQTPVLSSVALSWDIPQARADGTALELYEINGYIIEYGTNSSNLSQQLSVTGASETSALIAELSGGTYYFAIATVDSDGVQGAFSTTISQSI